MGMETISRADYDALPGVNPSLIKVLCLESPAACRYMMDHGSEPTEAMDVGTIAHAAILQPELFGLEYVVFEGARRAGKVWDEFCDANSGKSIMTAAQYEQAIGMRDAVFANEQARELLQRPGDSEVSLTWRDAESGLDCKGRLDRVAGDVLIDLKTCNQADPRRFSSQFVSLGYHIQLGAYVDGLWGDEATGHDVYVIAVEQKPFHDVVVYHVSPSALQRGIDLWRDGLKRFAECRKTGYWPGACPAVFELELPDWAMGRSQAELITIGGEAAFCEET